MTPLRAVPRDSALVPGLQRRTESVRHSQFARAASAARRRVADPPDVSRETTRSSRPQSTCSVIHAGVGCMVHARPVVSIRRRSSCAVQSRGRPHRWVDLVSRRESRTARRISKPGARRAPGAPAVDGLTIGRRPKSRAADIGPRAGRAHHGDLRVHEHTDPPSLRREPGQLHVADRHHARLRPCWLPRRSFDREGEPFPASSDRVDECQPPRAIFRFNGLRPDSSSASSSVRRQTHTSALRPTPRIFRANGSTEHCRRRLGQSVRDCAHASRAQARTLRALMSPGRLLVVGEGDTDLTADAQRQARRPQQANTRQRHRVGRSHGWHGRPSI